MYGTRAQFWPVRQLLISSYTRLGTATMSFEQQELIHIRDLGNQYFADATIRHCAHHFGQLGNPASQRL